MTPAIEVKDLSVFYGRNIALKSVNMIVQPGEYLGIIGPNGGGKSTLLKAILGLVPASKGQVRIFGGSLQENRSLLGFVPQFSSIERKFPISLYEVVLSGRMKAGLRGFARYSSEDHDQTQAAIEQIGLSHLSTRQVSQLSGGEFQRMLIARALVSQPKLLLLDEPTASVDATARRQIYELLGKLNEHMTIILVSHDMLAISSQVSSLACLNSHLVYHGEPELNENTVNSLYGCPVDLIAHGLPHRVLRDHSMGGVS